MEAEKILNTIIRGVSFVFGVVLLAMCYNTLLLPNNLVVGGMSGLSIIFQAAFGWDARTFVYISTFVLLVVSFVFLGKEKTYNTVLGSLLYPLMISVTQPICDYILQHSDVNEIVVLVCLAGFFYGVSNGIIFKLGYTTGGGDVIMQLLSKYCNITNARANFAYSIIIIALSGIMFGLSSLIYAVIILVIATYLIDKIIIGISNSKVFFISTQKLKEVKELINVEYESGYTCVPTKQEFFHKKHELLMVVIPSRDYFAFKNRILEIDPEAFFIINDCYDVGGGRRHKILPFE